MTGDGSSNVGALPAGISTLIGAGMQIVGDIACKGTLRVQGAILGNVHCDKNSGDALVVDSLGTVTGAVHAAHVAVRGRIVGPVNSAQSIEVHGGGSLTGDVSFRRLAVHAGGIVEGLLTPLSVGEQEEGRTNIPVPENRLTEPSAAAPAFRGGWRGIAAAAFVMLAVGGLWIAQDTGRDAPVDMAASPAVSPQEAPPPQRDSPQPESGALEAMQPELTPPPPAVQAEPADVPDNDAEDAITVKGANPSRPTGVFLLISKEASILHKKKRNEPGEGTRTAIAEGEKISVAIAPDEIIRISGGRDVTIYFQGQKVPRRAIENESWIRFVPK